MEKRLIIDRFEGEWAVVEYSDVSFNLPKELLPQDAKEGDILSFSIDVNKTATDDRKTEIRSLMDKLRKK